MKSRNRSITKNRSLRKRSLAGQPSADWKWTDDIAALAALLRRPLSLPMTKADWKNALGLLNHLEQCHRATLYIPGIGSALFHTEKVGIHCADPAFRFISDLFFQARSRCEREMGEAGRESSEKAANGPGLKMKGREK